MSNPASANIRIEDWAQAISASLAEVQNAWQDLLRRGLATEGDAEITVSPLAMRRANSDVQRRLASHLSGYILTENPFIVCRAGNTPGLPGILNTRISVEQIAVYFKEGWGVAEIERDLPVLTRAEIEAAIQYYLNHRSEIERGLQRTREIYETNAPKPETVPA